LDEMIRIILDKENNENAMERYREYEELLNKK
jgi:hypothetical protein